MAATKRPQNKCKSCGYTWYPRGKSLSNKCPNCGSTQVSKVWSWSGLAALLYVGYAIFANNDKPTDIKVEASAPYIASQATETTLERTNTELTPSTQQSDASKQGEQSNSLGLEETISSVEAKPTPSSICEHEGNIFSRNNCEWKECEKPEFSELEECVNKKPKENAFER